MQAQFTDAIALVWVVAMAVAAALLISGVRAFQKQGRLDPGIEAVLPSLGASRPSRDLVRAARWTRGWVGVPRRVVIRYASHIDDQDPRFVEQIVTSFSRRLGEEYRVLKHVPRRCVLTLELAPPSTPVSRERQRAEQVAKLLLGESSKVDITTDPDSGEVRRVQVKHDMGPRLAIPIRRMQVEKVISSMLPGRWRAHWDLEGDEVTFEIRPPMPDMVLHEPAPSTKQLTHSEYKSFKIPIGVDEDGSMQCWQPSVSPHMLVIGGTGSGKTSFQHTVLTHLAQARWRVWVLDGKRIEFAGFRTWPNVELVAARVEHQVRMLHAAHELMEQRYTQLERGTARLEDFEPLALIIDEYATFKARVQRWYKTVKPKGAPTQAPVLELLSDLARLARSAKIHMLLGIQRPDVEFLGGEMRDNFGARLSLGRLSPQGAMMMWDSPAIGVALPRNKRGRGVTLSADSLPVEIQAAYTPDPAKLDKSDAADWEHLRSLTPAETDHPRKMITEASPLISGDDEIPPTYDDWVGTRITLFDGIEDSVVVTPPVVLPSNVVALGARKASVRFEPVPEPDDVESAADVDEGGYGEICEGAAGELEVGDLVLTDPSLDLWVVVESVEPDIVDDDALAIEYRELESGDEGLMTVADNEVLTYRHPEAA
ncbi:FtsK/SpoIIIE domain-containing protein [Microbacterium sp. CH12i]|uniref:FtsK/SpoIIIE domain-containing protein n=1 Tax=Microbacterium sp. CH12i TaxID=1479651 RepID=UPI0013633025|nr:FtsK/SpoIIIE domain-containing protein [Microbacterium sp. CH12i]